jgi:hypothetical protein
MGPGLSGPARSGRSGWSAVFPGRVWEGPSSLSSKEADMPKLAKADIVQRVERLLSGEWDDDEMERLFRDISENVPCPFPKIQQYIFQTEGLSSEEIVDKMLAHRAIRL